MARRDRQSGVTSLTIHSSLRGIIAAFATGIAITGGGLLGVSRVGFRTLPTIILVVGLALLLIALLDFPVATTFDRSGFRRRMALRSSFVPWDDVRQLTRTRPSMFRLDKAMIPGGLAAAVGRKRILLVDRPESANEYDDLVALADDAGFSEVADMVNRPGEKVPPTWLYRRKHWHPESVTRR